MRPRDVRFLHGASSPAEFPESGLPEIAFSGRSNVGKSTLLNALVGRRGVARAGARPGTTQRVHWYVLDDALLLVDLPGYGYARVPEAVRAGWGPLLEGYLGRRPSLRLIWVLVDARHAPTELDRLMVDWLRSLGAPFRVVMTKADRLSGNERGVALARCAQALGLADGDGPVLTSARDGRGLQEVWRVIGEHLEAAERRGRRATTARRAPGAPTAAGGGEGEGRP